MTWTILWRTLLGILLASLPSLLRLPQVLWRPQGRSSRTRPLLQPLPIGPLPQCLLQLLPQPRPQLLLQLRQIPIQPMQQPQQLRLRRRSQYSDCQLAAAVRECIQEYQPTLWLQW